VLDELDVLDGRRGAIATLVNAVAVARQDPEVRSRLVLVTASLISLGDMTSETMAMDIGKILNLIAPILIGDFTLEPATIRGLAKGLPNSVDRDAIVEKVLTETGGQPHLTNLLLDRIQSRLIQDASIWDPTTLVTNEVGLLVEAAQTQRSPDFDHFLYAEQYLEKRLDVALLALEYFRSAQRSWPAPVIDPPNNDRIEWLLELTGLMKRSGTGFKIRSPIYRNVYSEQWIDRRRDILADRQSGADRSSSGPVLVVREHLPWIALLNCGGTLGMEKQADGIRAPDDLVIYLQSFSKIGDLARVHPVLNVPINDSANVAPADWGEIAKRIFETWKRFKDENTPLAGFVVAFGTDTLAHAAMGVALALGPALPVPVVFTGAQAPASALHGDAAANLARAAHVATEFGFKIDARQQPQAATLPEVIVVFGDHLYRGVRVEKRDDALFQGFHSPGYGPIGTIAEKVRLVPGYRPKDSSKTLPTDYWTPKPSFDRRVLLVSQYPGMVPTYFMDLLDATQRAGAPFTTDNPAPPFEQAPNLVRGVVIESLGVGNLPTRPSLSLLDFIRKSVALQIPVAVTARIPIQLDFVDAYEPARSAKEAGAKLVGSMTTAAVITKMMWLLSQADAGEGLREGQTIAEYVQTELETNYVGELGQP
jgi:L-asparaginase